MDLLILGYEPNFKEGTYRGTDRQIPSYREGLGDEHRANHLFFRYCSAGGESLIVHDLDLAKELVIAYSQLDPPQHFEIVEVTYDNRFPETAGQLLGFDLSAGYYSLIAAGIEFDRSLHYSPPQGDSFWILLPIMSLIKKYFQPQLNSKRLFDSFETASFCLACMMALQKFRPNLWENDEVKFKVVGLWSVMIDK